MQIYTHTKHISEEALGVHALNDLPESRSNLVDSHLAYCDRCRSQFREAQEFVMVLRLAARAGTGATVSMATH